MDPSSSNPTRMLLGAMSVPARKLLVDSAAQAVSTAIGEGCFYIREIYSHILKNLKNATAVKAPVLNDDAAIFRIGEIAFKVHADVWPVVRVNYENPVIRERLNQSGYCTNVFDCRRVPAGVGQKDFLVIAYDFVTGVTAADYIANSPGPEPDVNLGKFNEAFDAMRDDALIMGISICAGTLDVIVRADTQADVVPRLVVTDWNKLRVMNPNATA